MLWKRLFKKVVSVMLLWALFLQNSYAVIDIMWTSTNLKTWEKILNWTVWKDFTYKLIAATSFKWNSTNVNFTHNLPEWIIISDNPDIKSTCWDISEIQVNNIWEKWVIKIVNWTLKWFDEWWFCEISVNVTPLKVWTFHNVINIWDITSTDPFWNNDKNEYWAKSTIIIDPIPQTVIRWWKVIWWPWYYLRIENSYLANNTDWSEKLNLKKDLVFNWHHWVKIWNLLSNSCEWLSIVKTTKPYNDTETIKKDGKFFKFDSNEFEEIKVSWFLNKLSCDIVFDYEVKNTIWDYTHSVEHDILEDWSDFYRSYLWTVKPISLETWSYDSYIEWESELNSSSSTVIVEKKWLKVVQPKNTKILIDDTLWYWIWEYKLRFYNENNEIWNTNFKNTFPNSDINHKSWIILFDSIKTNTCWWTSSWEWTRTFNIENITIQPKSFCDITLNLKSSDVWTYSNKLNYTDNLNKIENTWEFTNEFNLLSNDRISLRSEIIVEKIEHLQTNKYITYGLEVKWIKWEFNELKKSHRAQAIAWIDEYELTIELNNTKNEKVTNIRIPENFRSKNESLNWFKEVELSQWKNITTTCWWNLNTEIDNTNWKFIFSWLELNWNSKCHIKIPLRYKEMYFIWTWWNHFLTSDINHSILPWTISYTWFETNTNKTNINERIIWVEQIPPFNIKITSDDESFYWKKNTLTIALETNSNEPIDLTNHRFISKVFEESKVWKNFKLKSIKTWDRYDSILLNDANHLWTYENWVITFNWKFDVPSKVLYELEFDNFTKEEYENLLNSWIVNTWTVFWKERNVSIDSTKKEMFIYNDPENTFWQDKKLNSYRINWNLLRWNRIWMYWFDLLEEVNFNSVIRFRKDVVQWWEVNLVEIEFESENWDLNPKWELLLDLSKYWLFWIDWWWPRNEYELLDWWNKILLKLDWRKSVYYFNAASVRWWTVTLSINSEDFTSNYWWIMNPSSESMLVLRNVHVWNSFEKNLIKVWEKTKYFLDFVNSHNSDDVWQTFERFIPWSIEVNSMLENQCWWQVDIVKDWLWTKLKFNWQNLRAESKCRISFEVTWVSKTEFLDFIKPNIYNTDLWRTNIESNFAAIIVNKDLEDWVIYKWKPEIILPKKKIVVWEETDAYLVFNKDIRKWYSSHKFFNFSFFNENWIHVEPKNNLDKDEFSKLEIRNNDWTLLRNHLCWIWENYKRNSDQTHFHDTNVWNELMIIKNQIHYDDSIKTVEDYVQRIHDLTSLQVVKDFLRVNFIENNEYDIAQSRHNNSFYSYFDEKIKEIQTEVSDFHIDNNSFYSNDVNESVDIYENPEKLLKEVNEEYCILPVTVRWDEVWIKEMQIKNYLIDHTYSDKNISFIWKEVFSESNIENIEVVDKAYLIRYIDITTNTEIESPITSTIEEEHKAINWYTFVNTDKTPMWDESRFKWIVTHYYKKNTENNHTVVVKFVDEQWVEIMKSMTKTWNNWTQYEFPYEIPSWYELVDENQRNINWVFTKDEIIKVVLRTERQQWDLIVKYVDKKTWLEIKSETITKKVWDNYDVSDKKETIFANYTFDSVKQWDQEVWIIKEWWNTVTLYYNPHITTKFLDSSCQWKETCDIPDLKEQCVWQINVCEATEIPWYIIPIVEPVCKDNVCVHYYVKKSSKINIVYLDSETNEEIINLTELNFKWFDKYDVANSSSNLNNNNYTFLRTEWETTWTINFDEKTIKHYYVKKSWNIKVEYKLVWTDQKVSTDYEETKKYWQTYDVRDKKKTDIKNYVYVSTTWNEQWTVSNDNTVITHFYSKKSWDVVVRFVDKDLYEQDNNTWDIKNPENIRTNYLDSYDTRDKKVEIDKYVFDSVVWNEQWTISEDNPTPKIVYLYNKKKWNITVNYFKNWTNEKLLDSYTETKKYDENYDVTNKKVEIPWYNLVTTVWIEKWTIEWDNIVINHNYVEKIWTVKVRHLDFHTETEVNQTETLTRWLASKDLNYSTTNKTIDWYTFTKIKDWDQANWIFQEWEKTITYYYTKSNRQNLIVKALDENWELLYTTTINKTKTWYSVDLESVKNNVDPTWKNLIYVWIKEWDVLECNNLTCLEDDEVIINFKRRAIEVNVRKYLKNVEWEHICRIFWMSFIDKNHNDFNKYKDLILKWNEDWLTKDVNILSTNWEDSLFINEETLNNLCIDTNKENWVLWRIKVTYWKETNENERSIVNTNSFTQDWVRIIDSVSKVLSHNNILDYTNTRILFSNDWLLGTWLNWIYDLNVELVPMKREVIVKYLDENWVVIKEQVSTKFTIWNNYDVSNSKVNEIWIYNFLRNEWDLNWLVSNNSLDPITVNLVYEKKKWNVTIQYVDDKWNKISDDFTKEFNYWDVYWIQPKAFDDYELVEITKDWNKTNDTSWIVNWNHLVVFKYKKKEWNINVQYIDKETWNILKETNEKVEYWNNYNIVREEIKNYTFESKEWNENWTISKENNNVLVKYYFIHDKWIVNVKYIDEETNKELKTENINWKVDENYNYVVSNIQDYEIIRTEWDLIWKFTKETKEIKVYLKKKTWNIKIRYIDSENWNILEQIISDWKIWDKINVEKKEFEWYTFERSTDLTNLIVKEWENIIELFYNKKQWSVTVKYVDENGKEIKWQETQRWKHWDKYEIKFVVSSWYTYVSTEWETIWTFNWDKIVIIRFKKNKEPRISYWSWPGWYVKIDNDDRVKVNEPITEIIVKDEPKKEIVEEKPTIILDEPKFIFDPVWPMETIEEEKPVEITKVKLPKTWADSTLNDSIEKIVKNNSNIREEHKSEIENILKIWLNSNVELSEKVSIGIDKWNKKIVYTFITKEREWDYVKETPLSLEFWYDWSDIIEVKDNSILKIIWIVLVLIIWLTALAFIKRKLKKNLK